MGHECEGNINGRQELAKSAIVADDEQAITDLVSTVLRYEGFDVEVASTGRAALDSVPSFRPDRSEDAGHSPDPFAPNAAEESALAIGPRGHWRDAFSARPEWRLDRKRSQGIDPPRRFLALAFRPRSATGSRSP